MADFTPAEQQTVSALSRRTLEINYLMLYAAAHDAATYTATRLRNPRLNGPDREVVDRLDAALRAALARVEGSA